MVLQSVRPGMSLEAFEAWMEERGHQSRSATGGGFREVRFGTNAQSIDYHNSDGTLRATGNVNFDPISAGVFGKDLDCRTIDDSLHRCGMARFTLEGELVSLIVLQQAMGVTREQIVSSLNESYGSPADRMDALVLDGFFRGEQYVWGASSTAQDGSSTSFTNISGPRHWQVEAALVEPTAERIAVIVQINRIATAAAGSGAAGGQIDF